MSGRTLVAIAMLVSLILLSGGRVLAWGPHPTIGIAAGKALAKDDPIVAYLNNNINMLGGLSYMNDWSRGALISGVGGVPVYTRDFFTQYNMLLPLSAYDGHGDPTTGSYESFFKRMLQAMRTETPHNGWGWLGAVLHDAEDTGAPPHAIKESGRRHNPMENWVDKNKIDITGYKPQLLGATEEEAIKGYVKRMNELHVFAVERANKLIPLVDANDRAAGEVLVLECALESARATADTLHTLGAMYAQMKPVPGGAGIAGKINVEFDLKVKRVVAKIMLEGANFSTLADREGRYEFRNLPPGQYNMIVMCPGYAPKTLPVKLEADKQITEDVELEKTGNLLRNGGLSVRWADPAVPEGWYDLTKGDEFAWRSEPITAEAGQAFKLTVKWKAGATGTAKIVWSHLNCKFDGVLQAPAESMVFPAPEAMERAAQAVIYINSKTNLLDSVESVSVTPEGEAAAKPAPPAKATKPKEAAATQPAK